MYDARWKVPRGGHRHDGLIRIRYFSAWMVTQPRSYILCKYCLKSTDLYYIRCPSPSCTCICARQKKATHKAFPTIRSNESAGGRYLPDLAFPSSFLALQSSSLSLFLTLTLSSNYFPFSSSIPTITSSTACSLVGTGTPYTYSYIPRSTSCKAQSSFSYKVNAVLSCS